ncbi:Kinase [Hexamita inflata]|uniref:Kinase n=1 Tax=Hexamita inflata TaxID=28002 RepID=A0ABP1I4C1_9EUKA
MRQNYEYSAIKCSGGTIYPQCYHEIIIDQNKLIADRYQIQKLIGKGAFGNVYQVLDINKKLQFAMKILKIKSEKESQEEKINRILNNQYQYIYDSGVYQGHRFIVSRLLDTDINQQSKLTIPQINSIFIQLITQLKQYNDCKVIHGDIKPQNILYTSDQHDQVQIIDLGSSYCSQILDSQKEQIASSLHYRAPEYIFKSQNISSIDIWSVAVTTIELLLQQKLFKGNTEQQVIEQICHLIGNPSINMIYDMPQYAQFFTILNNKVYLQRNNSSEVKSLKSILNQVNAQNVLLNDILCSMLIWDPKDRTIQKLLTHPYFKQVKNDTTINIQMKK